LPPSASIGNNDTPPLAFYAPSSTTFSGMGYLWMPTFIGTNSIGRADSIQRAIAKVDSASAPCGWIVDLRGNPGGLWPAMLAGLSPLITPGIVGGFVERDTTFRFRSLVQPGVAAIQDKS